MLRTPRLLSSLALPAFLVGCVSRGQPGPAGDPAGDPSGAAAARAAEGPAFDFRGDFTGPLGLQLYSVRNQIRDDVPGTLARVRALGFREVEGEPVQEPGPAGGAAGAASADPCGT